MPHTSFAGASTTLVNSLFEIVHGRFRFCNVIDNTISHAPRALLAEQVEGASLLYVVALVDPSSGVLVAAHPSASPVANLHARDVLTAQAYALARRRLR